MKIKNIACVFFFYRKHSCLFFLFLFYGFCLPAQQLYHFYHTLFNDLMLNPAAAGINHCKIAGVDIRKQWVGFSGSPETQNAFFHGSFYKKTGLGAIFFNDKAGAVKFNGMELDYAYQPIKNRDHILSFGLGATVLQYSLDNSSFKPELSGDPNLAGKMSKAMDFDAATGVYYKNNYFLVSIGIKHLIQPKFKLGDTHGNVIVRHYYLTASYNVIMNRKFRFEPSVFIRSIGRPFPQFDFSSKIIMKDKYWYGLAYRHKDAVIVFVGMDIGQLSVGYNYEYVVSMLNYNTSGSHELLLKYTFCKTNINNLCTDEEYSDKRKRRRYKSVNCPVW